MYTSLKKILHKFISPQQLVKHEVFLRQVYALQYNGNKHQCTVCNKKLSKFLTLPNNDLICPKCGSLSRDRRLFTIITEGYLKPQIKVLDFSPSRCLARKLKSDKTIEYISTDLSGKFIADFSFDITKIDLPSNSIDLIICYHILEHIDNDKLAMSELWRILKPGGHAIIQTPFKEGDGVYEDFSITNPKDREIHFGQDDHVRIYSVQGLKERLQLANFEVTATTYKANLYNGLRDNETVFIVKKP